MTALQAFRTNKHRVNKYKVKCGQTLQDWLGNGWIKKQDQVPQKVKDELHKYFDKYAPETLMLQLDINVPSDTMVTITFF